MATKLPETWTSSDGTVRKLSDMDSRHLANSLRVMERRLKAYTDAKSQNTAKKMIAALTAEQLRRDYSKKGKKADMSELWSRVATAITFAERTLLWGPPGTGKTRSAIHEGSPSSVAAVTMTIDTPAAELRGHFIPKGGEFVWHDGPAVRAWRTGARLVINEIDHAGGDALSFLLNVLDDQDNALMTLPSGETIRPHPAFSCVATMNGVPNDLPEALKDRFSIHIKIPTFHPNALLAIPEAYRAGVSRALENRKTDDLTLRGWLSIFRMATKMGDTSKPENVVRAMSVLMGQSTAENLVSALRMASA